MKDIFSHIFCSYSITGQHDDLFSFFWKCLSFSLQFRPEVCGHRHRGNVWEHPNKQHVLLLVQDWVDVVRYTLRKRLLQDVMWVHSNHTSTVKWWVNVFFYCKCHELHLLEEETCVVKILPVLQSSVPNCTTEFLVLNYSQINIIFYCQQSACIHKTAQLTLKASVFTDLTKKFVSQNKALNQKIVRKISINIFWVYFLFGYTLFR